MKPERDSARSLTASAVAVFGAALLGYAANGFVGVQAGIVGMLIILAFVYAVAASENS